MEEVLKEFAVAADFHFDYYKNLAKLDPKTLLTPRVEDGLQALRTIREYLVDHNINTFVIAGDLFHKSDNISVPLFNAVYTELKKFKEDNIHTIIIPGNHDLVDKRRVGKSSILGFQDIATVCLEPTLVTSSGASFFLVPYMSPTKAVKSVESFLDEFADVEKTFPNVVLIGHVGLRGAEYGDFEIVSDGPLSMEDLHVENFCGAYFGHYHKPQELRNNVWYVGAPLYHSFKDLFAGERGFVIGSFADAGLKSKLVPIKGMPRFEEYDAKEYVSLDPRPKNVFVRLSNVTKEEFYRVQDDPNVVKLRWAETEQREKRLDVNIGDDWEAIVDSYLDLMVADDVVPEARKSEFFNVGMEAINKIDIASFSAKTPITKFKLRARNYRGIGDNPVEVDFTEPGMTWIVGDNRTSKAKESNGAGKSTIPHALLYGLYGQDTSLLKETLVNTATGKNCEVTVVVEDKAGRTATITRRLCFEGKADGLFLELDGEEIEGTQAQLQKHIEAFIGLPKEVFRHAVILDEESSFAGVRPAERDEIFSKVLGLSPLADAYKLVANWASDGESKIETKEKKCHEVEVEISSLEEEKKRLKRSTEVWEKQQKEKISKEESYLASLEKEKKEQEDEIREAKRRWFMKSEKIGELEKALEKRNKEELKTKLDQLSEELLSLNRSIGRYEADIKRAQGNIKKMMDFGKGKCPTCLQDVSSDHKTEVIETSQNNIEKIKTNLEKEETKKKEVETKKKEVEKAVEEIENLEREKEGKELALEFDRQDQRKYKKQLERLKEKISSSKTKLEELSEEEPPQQESTKAVDAKVNQLREKISELREEQEKDQKQQVVYDFWKTGFSQSGLRNFLIEGILDDLNVLAARYAEALTAGELTVRFSPQTETAAGEKRNKLSIEVEDLYGSNSYETSSKGEKRRIDLITNLALHSLVSQKTAIPFLFADEVVVHLGETGSRLVTSLFKEVRKDVKSLFLITNQPIWSKSLFDRVWTMVREGKESWLKK